MFEILWMSGVWRVSGGCLEDVWMVYAGCLMSVQIVSGGYIWCPNGVWVIWMYLNGKSGEGN